MSFDISACSDEIAEKVAQKIDSTPEIADFTPEEAVEKYFEMRNWTGETRRTHESALRFFIKWCNEVADIEYMSELTGDTITEYQTWRREESSKQVDELAPKTISSQMKIIRKFIEKCESFDAVRPNLHLKVNVPDLNKEDEVCNDVLDITDAEEIIRYLEKYEYGSVYHAVFLLFARTGIRLGDIHSLDICDVCTNEEHSYLELRHRPKQGTRLKNGLDSERRIFLPDGVGKAIKDYIENRRTDVEDEFGRNPLFTSKEGRLAKSTIRNYVYKWTSPCAIGKDCPYDKDVSDCGAANQNNRASECPDSVSCHPLRKGYITSSLNAGVPKQVVSDRCDVSKRIIDKHYDWRDESEKMHARREVYKDVFDNRGD